MNNTIIVNDTVQLTSGGPIMTVESIGKPLYSDEEHAYCVWFEKGVKIRRDKFNLRNLKKA
jgi:uncharacterized protein YodC (DUF2158 family)